MLPQAYTAKLQALHERQELKHSLWDKLVFNKIKRELGFDRMRIMCTGRPTRLQLHSPGSSQRLRRCVCVCFLGGGVSGSAPLASHVLDFMRIITGSYIFEGYGQTETTAMTSITFPGDWTTGHVGGIAPVCEVRTQSHVP